jgi:hypothetical protein
MRSNVSTQQWLLGINSPEKAPTSNQSVVEGRKERSDRSEWRPWPRGSVTGESPRLECRVLVDSALVGVLEGKRERSLDALCSLEMTMK